MSFFIAWISFSGRARTSGGGRRFRPLATDELVEEGADEATDDGAGDVDDR
jgi:hypothetical protein